MDEWQRRVDAVWDAASDLGDEIVIEHMEQTIGVSQAGNGFRFGAVSGRRIDGFGSGVDRYAVGVRGVDDGGEDGEGGLEVGIDCLAAGAANAAIIDVHENIRADLQLGHAIDGGVDVVGARAAAGENGRVEACLDEQTARFDRFGHRLSRDALALIETHRVRGMTGISLDAADGQALAASDLLRQFDRQLARNAAGPLVAHIDIDQHVEADAGRFGSRGDARYGVS